MTHQERLDEWDEDVIPACNKYLSPYPYSSEEEEACMEAPYGERNQPRTNKGY